MYAVVKSVYLWSNDEIELPEIIGVFKDHDKAMKCMRDDFIAEFDYSSVEEYNDECDDDSERFDDSATWFEIDMEEDSGVTASYAWNIIELKGELFSELLEVGKV